MRSGRGKCPQCKEIIVVDLDAPEIRCPLCNALLKKSQKTVEEVRAEEEARVAAAMAREKALEEEAAAAETPVTEEPETAVEESPATEVAEEAVEVAPAEEAVEEIAEADVLWGGGWHHTIGLLRVYNIANYLRYEARHVVVVEQRRSAKVVLL